MAVASAPSTGIRGCHLVGSVPFSDAETVFRESARRMPNRLPRIPDGETNERNYFTVWQFAGFKDATLAINPIIYNQAARVTDFTAAEIQDGIAQVRNLNLETRYDEVAMENYKTFKRLRDEEGVIPKGTKFQVCLPTGASVVICLHHQFREAGFEVYEAALFRAMRKMQDAIPHEDLSIQIDLAVDTAFWEGVYEKPWFENPKETTVEYIVRMISQVDPDVEVGLHNCYGDMEHRHWMEPTSLRAVTDRGLAILARTPHKLSYFHCPVPLSASDFLPDYFAPLADLYPALSSHGCELYLGLVHFNDLEGTKTRIAEAQKLAPEFGVATECGLGRTPPEQIEELMRLSAELSGPVVLGGGGGER